MVRHLVWVVLVVGGCGGVGAPAGPGPCSTAVTGFVTGSVTCTGEIISYESIMNTSTFSLAGGAVGNTTGALQNSTLIWVGQPKAGTDYESNVTAADGSVSAMVNGKMHAWLARFAPQPPTNEPNVGSYHLSLSSMSTITSSGVVTEYYAHGSAELTLVDQDPAPEPDIHVTAQF